MGTLLKPTLYGSGSFGLGGGYGLNKAAFGSFGVGGGFGPAKLGWVWNGAAYKLVYSTPNGTLSGGGANAASGASTAGRAQVNATANPGGNHSGNLSYAWQNGGALSYFNSNTATITAYYDFAGVANGTTSGPQSNTGLYCIITDNVTGAQWQTDPITVGPLTWQNTIPAYAGRTTDYDGALGADASGTDTIDANASQVTIEVWGGGGSGQRNNNPCTPVRGGSSGSYSRTVLALTAGDWGKTISWFSGRAAPVVNSGNSTGFDGTASSVSNGTYALTTMNAPGGAGGALALQGSASGGNAANSAGNLGGLPAGGTAVAAVSGPGSGNGGAGFAGPSGTSFQGAPGRTRFTYIP